MCIKQTYGLSIALFFIYPIAAQAQLAPPKTTQSAQDSADLANIWFQKAEIKYDLRNYAESIADYDEALRLSPNNALAFNKRGNAQYNLGRYPEAMLNYDQAIRCKPDYAIAYNSRGVTKRNLGLIKEAIADYDYAIRLKPDYATAFNSRGMAKTSLKQYKEAVSDFDKAIQLNPNYAKAYANKGCCLVQMTDKTRLNEAIECLDKGLFLDGLLMYAQDCKKEALRRVKSDE
jgi:tetratricopeptide (TPR) repeat protein